MTKGADLKGETPTHSSGRRSDGTGWSARSTTAAGANDAGEKVGGNGEENGEREDGGGVL